MSENEEKDIPWYKHPTVIAALITAIGTIIVALMVNQQSQPNGVDINMTQIQTVQTMNTPTQSTIVIQTNVAPTDTSNPLPSSGKLPMIDWGIMKANFVIEDEKLGKAISTDMMGAASEYNSLDFIVTAKNTFYNSIAFQAQFFDENGIKIFFSIVKFDPEPMQWQQGDKSRGHIMLPDKETYEKVREIKISTFY